MKVAPTYSILLAEDDENNAELLIRHLERYNFDVDHVVDGVAAEIKLRKARYDLILTDNRMPKLGGIDLLERIPEMNRLTPIIFLTVSNEKETIIQAAHNKKLVAYLLKPIDTRVLIEKICQALNIGVDSLVDKKEYPFEIIPLNYTQQGAEVEIELKGCPYGKNIEKLVQEISFFLKELPKPNSILIKVNPEFFYFKTGGQILYALKDRLAIKYEIRKEDVIIQTEH
ncbi:response regulator [Leptospira santarosai]|uniref:Chemotaxis protein CheY n=3 Tax=Leptospira santarosai TaxID=28183 RepID=K8XU77_9LEPT|nr:response regulator [Leptospira santarosai]EKO32815.1 response regulator receiver domain protein [Leptospira santarosai str. MOR084]EKR90102.1 response regulator receiver domain protein [Leptospira santarosai str. CBC379]EKS08551.1 response regulator receiver domain protein [Leptospira santarosai str. JET]EKT84984.1 chemotaxis protein CheY [Leptospira santarosai serovar Shermani str. LT 821]EMN21957.1 response regulator receiver domain protein [Leptospira santarosai serovar Arenal str. MAVJ 